MMAAVRDQLFDGDIPTKLETAVNEFFDGHDFNHLVHEWGSTVLQYIYKALFFEWWVFSFTAVFLVAGFAILVALLIPLPRCLRRTYFPAVIGTGSLVAQPPNLALLFKGRPDVQEKCINCSHHISKDQLYLRQLSGLLRPFHARHRRAIHRSHNNAQSNYFVPPSDSLVQIQHLLHPHCVVECFSESHRRVLDSEVNRVFSDIPIGHRRQLENCNVEHKQRIAGDTQQPNQNPYVLEERTSVSGSGGELLCGTCALESALMRSSSSQREELLQACPTLQEGYTPDSILLRHRLMQGALVYLQEEWNSFKLIDFDRRYWVTSADGDGILLHYCRHRTNLKACGTGCRSGASKVESHAGCTDDRFSRGHPHGLCGCRGIIFIVGGIGAKARDLQVQHVAQIATAKGFCVFFMSCLRGIEAPISHLPTDLTTSSDAQAALAFIVYLHVKGFGLPSQHAPQKDIKEHRTQPTEAQSNSSNNALTQTVGAGFNDVPAVSCSDRGRGILLLEEEDATFRSIIANGLDEEFLRTVPSDAIPPLFLLGYSMGSCAVMRLLGALGLQKSLSQVESKQGFVFENGECSKAFSSRGEACRERDTADNERHLPCSLPAVNSTTPFFRELASAVATERIPSLEWLRFIKGAVTVSNAMCLDSCIGSLDRAGGITGRLCQQAMLRMYKAKQWLEPSNSYVKKGLDPGLVALSQMTTSIREIDLLTHLSVCLTPASPLSCTRVYYALASCLSHMLMVPVPLLCLHAMDDPIVEPLAVCRAAATVPRYNHNCSYVVLKRGGHNIFQESFWPLLGSAKFFSFARDFMRRWRRSSSKVQKTPPLADDNFQARLVMEFISGVWRRCD